MGSNDNLKRKKSHAKRQAQSVKAPEQKINDAEELYDDISGAFLVKYNINDKGIGHIHLPPSLSMVLQSDRICVSPSGGGLFIRSI
jgi:hypothetical protein